MIAILVLTYNNLETNKKFIEKVYRNTKNYFKLFVLDNGSQDGTVEYLSSLGYGNLTVFFNERNEGVIDGRNKLWELVNHINNFEYLCFLDNDQFVEEGWDNIYLEMMRIYDVVGKEAWQMRQDFRPFRRIKDESEYFNYVGCGGMMIKRKVVEDIGLFEKQFNPKYFEDPDFCFRAIKSGYKIGWCSDDIIIHQKHNLALSSKERIPFMKNLKIIQSKWRNFPLPKIKNEKG